MAKRDTFCEFSFCERHKGFYNDGDPENSLSNIHYDEFSKYPDDVDFPYASAWQLLRGSCHHFALSLKKKLNYTPYIIEGIYGGSFHCFCQIYRNGKWYYVDARGITTSFDEFMRVAKTFVTDEFIIRPVKTSDVDEWERDDNYNNEAHAFAEAVIEKYKECYIL